ncbi:MAG: hypothetical protein EXQ85_02480 [Alphaproteobacteria bacterium]|nr:hypothetical protein [Alphaproteobacteria bacterium]
MTQPPATGITSPVTTRGAEREIAILFADIRAFTALSEQKLPYDVVFVLNQYHRAMGSAVEAAGGRLETMNKEFRSQLIVSARVQN